MRHSFLLFLGTAGILFASAAMATDESATVADTPVLAVTNPFYRPKAGHVALTTDAAYHRTHVKTAAGQGATAYQTVISESVAVGVTDNLTLIGTFGNVFDRRSFWNAPTYQRDKNLDFEAGFAYTLPETDARRFQAALTYGQRQSFSRFTRGEYKYVSGAFKSGYRMENVTSFFAGSVEIPVAQNENAPDEPRYRAVIGSNGLFVNNTVSTDVALRFDYASECSVRAWSADAGMAYLFTPAVALGIKASYTFKATGGDNSDWFRKSVGVFFKTAF